jgi:hypothetical protein
MWREALIAFTELGVETKQSRLSREPHPLSSKIASWRSIFHLAGARKLPALSMAVGCPLVAG